MRNFIRVIVFVAVGCWILQITENILEKKWNYPGDYEEVPKIINEFYGLEKESLEAVFLGKSSVKLAVSPIQIYKDSNIVTYNLASSAQPIQISYYLLQEVFKSQTPELVFLDASELFRGSVSEDYSWHFIMDNTPWSMNKMEAATSYMNEEKGRDFLSIMSPLYYYHARWDELTKNDFMKQDNTEYYYSAGQYMTSLVSGTSLTYENINSEIDVMNRQQGFKEEYVGHTCKKYEIEGDLYHVTWNQTAVAYIKKMQKACEKHGAQLVLLKIPTIGMPQVNYISWSRDKYKMVKEFCDEISVPFFDMVYDTTYEAGINWLEDTIDGGAHLNTRGAEKVTSCITAYLEKQGLKRKIDELFYQSAEDYDRVNRVCLMQSEFDLVKYIERILANEDYTIVISAQNDFQASLSEERLEALRRLGLQSCFTNNLRDSFIGIIDHHKVIYESISNRRMDYEKFLPGGGKMEIISSGLNTGALSSVKIDGKEYSTNMCGLNFVVWDNRTNLVVDSVCFNTSLSGAAGFRNKSVTLKYLAQYKQAVNGQARQ